MLRIAIAILLITASAHAAAPRKKLIATGWDHPDAARFLANQAQMDAQPFDGTVIDLVGQREGAKSLRLAAAFSREPWKEDWFAASIESLRAARPARLTDNFILVGANPGDVDWFDDAGWAAIVDHWRIATRIARQGRQKGILFDPEPYSPPHAQFSYAAQPQRGQHTFDAYAAKARERGRQVMQAVAQEHPDLVLFTYFMNSVVAPAASHADPKPALAGHGYGLYPAFIDGWLDAIPPTITLVDGCESAYLYNSDLEFLESTVRIKGICQQLVSPENRPKYRAQVQVSFGIYLDAYANPPTSPWHIGNDGGPRVERLRANVSTALRCADEYVWIYGEKHRWWPTPNGRVEASSWADALPGSADALRYARDPVDYARMRLEAGRMANLLQNGDFGSDRGWKEGRPPAGWSAWQDDSSKGAFAWDREVGAGGKGSGRAAGVVAGCFLQSVPAKPGQRYAVRALARTQGGGDVSLRIRWQAADGRWTSETLDVMAYPAAAGEWRELLAVAEVPPAAGRIVILLLASHQASAGDQAWFDDAGLFLLD